MLFLKFIGSENVKYLVIVWGLMFYVVEEVFEKFGRDDVVLFYFSWVYLFKLKVREFFEGKVFIDVENNIIG